jgi:hypothetical protein
MGKTPDERQLLLKVLYQFVTDFASLPLQAAKKLQHTLSD